MDSLAARFLEGVKNVLLGWVPDWIWTVIALWPYIWWSLIFILVVSVFHKFYKIGGWPGLAASIGAAGIGLGFYLGRKTRKKTQPTPVKPKAREPHTYPKDHETAWDRWERRING